MGQWFIRNENVRLLFKSHIYMKCTWYGAWIKLVSLDSSVGSLRVMGTLAPTSSEWVNDSFATSTYVLRRPIPRISIVPRLSMRKGLRFNCLNERNKKADLLLYLQFHLQQMFLFMKYVPMMRSIHNYWYEIKIYFHIFLVSFKTFEALLVIKPFTFHDA